MRVRKNSTLPLLASTAILSTNILTSASSITTSASFPQSPAIPAASSPIAAATTYATPTSAPIGERAAIEAPPDTKPAKPTQMSPVMNVVVDGKNVMYTQKFSAVPDQWPKPSSGSIGLGTLSGKETKTADKRSEPTGSSSLKLRCRTAECRKRIEDAEEEKKKKK